MADPAIQALRAGPESLAGSAIPFRFEVTWRSLTRPLEPTAASSSLAVVNPPARRAPVRDVEAREWEMVLPRMRRRVTIAPPSVETQDAPVSAPSFAVAVDRQWGPRWILLAGTPLLILAAAVYWGGQRRPAADEAAASTMEMGSAGWISEWASDRTGSARGRQISLYRPSMPTSDYRLEFIGRIERRSLGWVFRAADSKNYYAGKFEAAQPGSSPLTITRFAVIKGVEGPHFQRVLAHSPGPLKVRLEAKGSRFTVYLQNQVVEDWQDDRLKKGGVGFLNERDERGQVGSIQISFLRGGVH